MRNFKKFLALVLAMLMVSACAVSVSAAYSDQDAIDATGFAKAVSLLYDLKVMQGSGDGSFNPNGTLTRAEAAVIASKLKAGTAGQTMNWTSATSAFADVAPEYWGNAYINYVSQRGIMDGIGDGKFAPEATLSIAEAIVIAVKTAGLQGEVAKLNETFGVPTFWAANWIAVAGGTRSEGTAEGLLDNIVAFDYTAPCTRAMFAQIAFNMIDKNIAGIKNGFGLETEIAVVEAVNDGKVTLDDDTVPQIAESALDAALAAAGIEKKSADLIDHKIKMLWNASTYAIYSVDVLTTAYEATYAADAIKYVKDGDTLVADKLNVIGVDYVVNTVNSDADANVTPDIIGGTVSTATNGIKIEIDGANVATVTDSTIPAYYKVVGYDDNGDMDLERAFVTSYDLAVLVDGGTVKVDDKDVQVTKINAIDGTPIASIQAATFTGVATTYGEAPVLLRVDGTNVDVLELAEKVTGVVTNIKAGSYITIGKAYNFATEFVAPASWVLGQNVTIYTINGKYVAVASADTGIESGMVEKTVRVDNVVVENGAAIVTGYLGDTFEAVTLKVVGIVADSGKLIAKNSYEIANKVTIDGTEKTFAGQIEIADKNADGVTTTQYVAFADDASYTFAVTSAGAYFKAGADTIDYETRDLAKVEIKNGYIYIDGTAQYKMAASYTVVTEALKFGIENNYNFYADTYTVAANAALKADTATLGFFDADNAVVSAGQVDKTVALVYVVTSANAAEIKTVASLAANETIVQIVSVESEALDYTTYNAIDLFTGAKVTVDGSAALKGFYVAAAGKIVEVAKWIGNHNVTIETVLDMQTIKACNTKLVGDDKVLTADGDAVTFGVDAIKAYKLVDGVIDLENAGVVSEALAATIYGYIDNGQMIILY